LHVTRAGQLVLAAMSFVKAPGRQERQVRTIEIRTLASFLSWRFFLSDRHWC